MGKKLCSKISVDCVPNDVVDNRCGGPLFLGFDFYVLSTETKNMMEFIRLTLEEFHVPLIQIYVSEENVSVKKYFTKQMIVSTIKRDSEYLIDEANSRENDIHSYKVERKL